MKKYLANAVTSARILCGIWMMLSPVFSASFYSAYLIGGLTDMVDGTVARKTNSVTKGGERLDSAADFVFILAAFIKILPAVSMPVWIMVWSGIIFLIRVINAVLGLLLKRRLVFEHTALNKITGFILFLTPMTLTFVDLRYSAAAVCVLATLAAVEEGRHICSAGWNESV